MEHVCTLLLTNRGFGHELQLGMCASLHDLSNPGTTEHELKVHISVCVVLLVLLQAQLATSIMHDTGPRHHHQHASHNSGNHPTFVSLVCIAEAL